MNGIIFFEDGTVRVFGQLTTVKMIALKVQEVIPELVQQERNAVIESLTNEEIRRAVDSRVRNNRDDE